MKSKEIPFFIKRFLFKEYRKLSGLDNLSNLNKEYQLKCFKNLKEEFINNILSIPPPPKDFVLSFWEEKMESLKKRVLLNFNSSFLNIPEIYGTMVINNEYNLMKKELKYLKSKINIKKLKELLKEDSIGGPKIISKNYLTSHNQIHNLYHLTKFIELSNLKIDKIKTIIEWGGGYGCLAKIINSIKKDDLTYVIIDLPLFSCIQWIYLSCIFGKSKINLIKSKENKILSNKINLLPISFLKSKKIKGELFISNWALSESSKEAQEYVYKENWFGAKNILIGSQENNSIITSANNLINRLKKQGAFMTELSFQKGNYYLILKR